MNEQSPARAVGRHERCGTSRQPSQPDEPGGQGLQPDRAGHRHDRDRRRPHRPAQHAWCDSAGTDDRQAAHTRHLAGQASHRESRGLGVQQRGDEPVGVDGGPDDPRDCTGSDVRGRVRGFRWNRAVLQVRRHGCRNDLRVAHVRDGSLGGGRGLSPGDCDRRMAVIRAETHDAILLSGVPARLLLISRQQRQGRGDRRADHRHGSVGRRHVRGHAPGTPQCACRHECVDVANLDRRCCQCDGLRRSARRRGYGSRLHWVGDRCRRVPSPDR